MFEKSLADGALHSADVALDTAQRAASHALDSMGAAIDRGVDRARATTHQVRDSALRASEGTVNYIRHDPVKSVLIAAATGAALMALVSLLTRHNGRG
ncbi:MAG: hypothetical protein HXX19_13115 [Rhodoferax sp.]|nr:hypothetical protein [Rhodoferax sp.]